MIKISHPESIWKIFMGKDGEKCEMTKIRHSESFWTTLVEKIGESAKQSELGIPNHFGPPWWEKTRKGVK